MRQITTCGFLNQADWRSKIDRDRQQRLREVMDEFFARFVVSTTMRKGILCKFFCGYNLKKSKYMIGAGGIVSRSRACQQPVTIMRLGGGVLWVEKSFFIFTSDKVIKPSEL